VEPGPGTILSELIARHFRRSEPSANGSQPRSPKNTKHQPIRWETGMVSDVTGARPRRARASWTLGRKFAAAFAAALVLGFVVLVGLQAMNQRATLVEISETDARVKTEMLAVAVRIGISAKDGASVISEFKGLAEAEDTQLASVA